MNKGLLAYFALAFFCATGKASAQFNDARAYDNTPVGVSQLELDYPGATASRFACRSANKTPPIHCVEVLKPPAVVP